MVKEIFVLNNLTLKGGIALMELKQMSWIDDAVH
jgi:hypothetical protein